MRAHPFSAPIALVLLHVLLVIDLYRPDQPRLFMFLCCCVRLHRHQLHLASYGFVSMSLIVTGFVFTVFAVFHRDSPSPPNESTMAEKDQQNDRSAWDWVGRSRLGKIWLAGPVLMVVGAVLCGKVMIDWGPAMSRGRTGSLDSQLVDELAFANLLPIGAVDDKARLSLATGCSTTTAPKTADEPLLSNQMMMKTARCSCASVLSSSNDDHLLLASMGGISIPTSFAPNNYHKLLSCHAPPFSARHPPPSFNAFDGSSSSASSISSQKVIVSAASDSDAAAFHFDRIIYAPTADQFLLIDNDGDDGKEKEEDRQKLVKMVTKLDKSTQSERDGADVCKRCATFWPILEATRNTRNNCPTGEDNDEGRPKVIGKFFFANLLEKAEQKSPNYGAILMPNDDGDRQRRQRHETNAGVSETYPEQLQHNNNNNRRTRARSQGETLLLNERSFLV